jgi:dCTP diphosphatase
MIDNKKISEALREFANERDWNQFHTPRNLAASISVESAELLELFQWSSGSNWTDLNNTDLRSKCSHELADILIYLMRFSDLSGIDLEKAVLEKIEINRKKYPVEKSKGSDKKYHNL